MTISIQAGVENACQAMTEMGVDISPSQCGTIVNLFLEQAIADPEPVPFQCHNCGAPHDLRAGINALLQIFADEAAAVKDET